MKIIYKIFVTVFLLVNVIRPAQQSEDTALDQAGEELLAEIIQQPMLSKLPQIKFLFRSGVNPNSNIVNQALLKTIKNFPDDQEIKYFFDAFIKAGYDFKIKNKQPREETNGWGWAFYIQNPLQAAMLNKNSKLVEYFCNSGAPIDDGFYSRGDKRLIITPLSLGILTCNQVSNLENIRTILKFGALLKPSKKGKADSDPLDLATKWFEKNKDNPWCTDLTANLKWIIEMLKAEPKRRLDILKNLKQALHIEHNIPSAVADMVCDYTFNKEDLESHE